MSLKPTKSPYCTVSFSQPTKRRAATRTVTRLARSRRPLSAGLSPQSLGGHVLGQPAATATHNPNNDVEVANAATDTSVRLVEPFGQLPGGRWGTTRSAVGRCRPTAPVPKAAICTTGPCYARGATTGARLHRQLRQDGQGDLATGQATRWRGHDQPIKSIHWVQEMSVVTASWTRPSSTGTARPPPRAPCCSCPSARTVDIRYPLMVIATADRKIVVVNLTNPQTIYSTTTSLLKYRAAASPASPTSRATASAPSRGASPFTTCMTVTRPRTLPSSATATTRCVLASAASRTLPPCLTASHRRSPPPRLLSPCRPLPSLQDIYAVNHITFHPTYGTFATTGSDGTFNTGQGLGSAQGIRQGDLPIPVGANRDGTIFAYATSYDWSKGSEHYNPKTNRMLLTPSPRPRSAHETPRPRTRAALARALVESLRACNTARAPRSQPWAMRDAQDPRRLSIVGFGCSVEVGGH